MSTSVVGICNLALSHLGADNIIASIDPPDGSVEAGRCAQLYPIARQEMLEMFPWTFAKTRVALSALASNPSKVWRYAYAAPSDALQNRRILTTSTLDVYGFFPFGGLLRADEAALFTEQGSADFQVENGVFLTNEPDAVLLYVRDVIDPSQFTPGFTVALSLLLASYLAGPIIRGATGTQAAMTLREMAGKKGREAMIVDANGVGETSSFVPEHIRRRA